MPEEMEPINMQERRTIDPQRYFERIVGNGEIELEPARFYLFGTREEVILGNVVGRLAREHALSGTGLWNHFAGFFMKGFRGPITLETWSLNGRVVEDGEPAGTVEFDEVEGEGGEYAGEYQHQEVPKLPKMFKPWAA